jgi:two-component system, OmpR family, phosphate regulon sensor histidine kinase PhoR
MKLNRTYLFIAISSAALVIVLIIQINWILQTAKIKEELFNEKANMVLSKTAEVLTSDKETFNTIAKSVGRKEVRKIDSLFNYYMTFYNIHIGYYFEVKPDKGLITTNGNRGFINNLNTNQSGCYTQCLQDNNGKVAGADKNALELKLVFPEKEEFIIQEMGIPFISSVILILIVLFMFWQTVLSLMKEKKISEHTADFLNNMTHEFKTPLTNIALAGKMISKNPVVQQEDKVKHYSEIILQENEKLRLQVEQVLSMTALERGEIPVQKAELDFHKLIQDAVTCMSIQIENKQGHLTLNLKAKSFVLMGDKTHLINALCNLIDNAIKYAKQQPEITLQTFNSDKNLVLVISDNGIGIEKKYHEKVFDKFFRVPTGNVHDVKGFGLGLAYTKKIVHLHEGTIELESQTENGTTFTITLPNG